MLTYDCPHFFLPILLQRKMKSTLVSFTKLSIFPGMSHFFILNSGSGTQSTNFLVHAINALLIKTMFVLFNVILLLYCLICYSFSISVECEIDPDCRTDQVCHQNKCLDPCLLDNPCAVNAICSANNHAARCQCPQGLIGNPYELCEKVECYVNRDCDTTKACIQNQCLDPCLIAAECAPTATCRVINHDASCTCPPGTVGDPFVECTPRPPPESVLTVECEVDSECPSGLCSEFQKRPHFFSEVGG